MKMEKIRDINYEYFDENAYLKYEKVKFESRNEQIYFDSIRRFEFSKEFCRDYLIAIQIYNINIGFNQLETKKLNIYLLIYCDKLSKYLLNLNGNNENYTESYIRWPKPELPPNELYNFNKFQIQNLLALYLIEKHIDEIRIFQMLFYNKKKIIEFYKKCQDLKDAEINEELKKLRICRLRWREYINSGVKREDNEQIGMLYRGLALKILDFEKIISILEKWLRKEEELRTNGQFEYFDKSVYNFDQQKYDITKLLCKDKDEINFIIERSRNVFEILDYLFYIESEYISRLWNSFPNKNILSDVIQYETSCILLEENIMSCSYLVDSLNFDGRNEKIDNFHKEAQLRFEHPNDYFYYVSELFITTSDLSATVKSTKVDFLKVLPNLYLYEILLCNNSLKHYENCSLVEEIFYELIKNVKNEKIQDRLWDLANTTRNLINQFKIRSGNNYHIQGH
ncbi:hypothetical protein A3Q56_08153 [Intoshia linei]|uniref:Uncharacterized protein n=1 Tax=Intoshia linei TaxID=1819745 RepID=A0A177AQ77_9BILA|nr:hypothetical protein A3Q56_08153 [Intoshia linei]